MMFCAFTFFIINMAASICGKVASLSIVLGSIEVFAETQILLNILFGRVPLTLSALHFFMNPWYFEIPIIYKPMFLNMDFELESTQISDLLLDTH